LAPSTTEAGRNVTQGGVHLNGKKVTDKALQVQPGTYTLQVGKRKWAKVTLK
ncbi:tyrosine--tRNA ligase, partial [Turicibacter sanguinis]|nr:tyrosine--tRNA ligase [Turicibacter sanguinis]